MSSSLDGSSALQLFKCSYVVELCNGIMFDFYQGLPHLIWTHSSGANGVTATTVGGLNDK